MNPATREPAADWSSLLQLSEVKKLIDLAVQEDVGKGDVTTESIFAGPQASRGRIITREETVTCGMPLVAAILRRFDANAVVTPTAKEGTRVSAGDTLVEIEADVRALLTTERCILNFMMRLCGIATAARLAVEAVPSDCRAKIFDTRKTTPGWRYLDKAAVATGGAQNHRVGLFDAVLIKDNHLVAAGSIREAVHRARKHVGDDMPVEVEIDRLDQLDEAVDAGADIILLDNFPCEEMSKAVLRAGDRVEFEASGGIKLENIPSVARTGVHRISLGALTHTVRPAELSMDLLE